MKKKFLNFILTITTILACIFGFSACSKKECQISFMVDNAVYATVSTSGNETISIPKDPTKYGYAFDGWYLDENVWKEPFTKDSLRKEPLTSDIKVYAKFKINHPHEFSLTTTEPTCTEKGVTIYLCACGETYKEETPALGHDETTYEAKTPTCAEIGWEEYVVCEREGCGYSTYKEISATGLHTWNEGEETTAPTCTKQGVHTYTCEVCETTKTEDLNKIPHAYAQEWSSNSTHHWHECACGDKVNERKHIPSEPATVSTAQICTVCNYELQAETGIVFNTLPLDGLLVFNTVSNAITEFSFVEEITVVGEATYVVALDEEGKQLIETKIVSLVEGDNVFYILQKNGEETVNTYTVAIRRKPMYEVTFNTIGGSAVASQAVEEGFLATMPEGEPTKVGYTFNGWGFDFDTPITANTEVVANWNANTDTKYTVVYYLQNIDDDEYTEYERVELQGETDTTATAEIKEYAQFTYNEGKRTIQGNIDGDGSLVLGVYYTRDQYAVSTARNNANAGSVTLGGTYRFDKEITLTATTNVGYTWLGWYEGETLVTEEEEWTFKVEKTVTYTAKWSANTDTKYTVHYYLQNVEDDGYALYETAEEEAETDAVATAEIKEYPHFTYNPNKSEIRGNVNPDGSRVLSVYYTRDSYTITTVCDNKKAGIVTAGDTYRYEKEVTLTATTNEGYTFLGWYEGEELVCKTEKFTVNVQTDATYTATWSKNEDTKYTVNYYLQNVEDDGYALYETVELEGETEATATAEIKEYTHFTYNENESVISGDINGDSSLVLSVYYTRDCYTITTVCDNKKAGIVTAGDTYRFDTEITLIATTNIGYTFLGWYEGEDVVCETEEFTVNVEKHATYTAKWSAKLDTKYTVNYYWQNIENDDYTLYETIELQGETDTTATADVKEYKYAVYNEDESKNVLSGNIDRDGGLVLRVYYTRKTYALSNANPSLGSITNAGTYRYGKAITVTATVKLLGYDFIGWYTGETLLSNEETYAFNIEQDVVARFGLKEEMSNFLFTSTETECVIIGLQDETVISIVLPDYVTGIGDDAFYSCSGLTSVLIPDSVTNIGDCAFYGCNNLTSVYYSGTASEWLNVSIAEDNNPLESATLYHYSQHRPTQKGNYWHYDENNQPVVWESGDPEKPIVVSQGLDYTLLADNTYEVTDMGDCTDTELVIPNEHNGKAVTRIGEVAFKNKSNLTSVVIPDSVTSIGNHAFYGCDNLTSVVIPDGVTSIGDKAFNCCYNLASVSIPNSVMSIGNYAFENCVSLVNVVIGKGVTNIGNAAFNNCYTLTNVVIPDSVTSIGWSAFAGCKRLTSLVVGKSVTSIGYGAFASCTNLTSVYYKGTEREWDEINFDSDNDYLMSATCYYYSENRPTKEGNYWHYDENNQLVVWEDQQ